MQCLVDLYNREKVECDSSGFPVEVPLNGSFSLNGNLADLIGLQVAYESFKNKAITRTEASELPVPLRLFRRPTVLFVLR